MLYIHIRTLYLWTCWRIPAAQRRTILPQATSALYISHRRFTELSDI